MFINKKIINVIEKTGEKHCLLLDGLNSRTIKGEGGGQWKFIVSTSSEKKL